MVRSTPIQSLQAPPLPSGRLTTEHTRDSFALRGRCSASIQRVDAIPQTQTTMSAGNLELQVPDMFVQAIAERVADLLVDSLSARTIDRNLESEEIQ